MKVTVCELPNDPNHLIIAWQQLLEHLDKQHSELLLLPEMPFFRWLAHNKPESFHEWEKAVEAHNRWIERLTELPVSLILGSRAAFNKGKRQNIAFTWNKENGQQDIHSKYYLPDEPEYWEASWYERGDGNFAPVQTTLGTIGFLICTELWFNWHAREYGKQGIQMLACPRVTPKSSTEKWIAGGQAAAVISGAYCLSSNLSGTTAEGCNFAGKGWIIEPEEGEVMGLTSEDKPFLTLDIELEKADQAKNGYPRYVLD